MNRQKKNDDMISVTKQELMRLLSEEDSFKKLFQTLLQEVLEAEMEQALCAGKSERVSTRLGYRSGYYTRGLVTRVGKLELRVPQDRAGKFSTELFERYQRSEKALVGALMEMYVQGVSTRRVKAITEELCGHQFSASAVSQINKSLDEELERFMTRKLDEEYPYLILDARYERVREEGVSCSRAVLVSLGIGWDGRRHVLSVELAGRESAGSWKEHLLRLKERGLRGVRLAVSDDHPGLKRAVMEVLPEAWWQRCYVHFLRNCLDHLPRRQKDECLLELRWVYECPDLAGARRVLGEWLSRWSAKHPKLCAWVEENIEETHTYYRLPREHHKHLKSTNMLERLNQELKRRTLLVRIFPNETSCLRLVRAVSVEVHEQWIEEHRYLDMEVLREHLKGGTEFRYVA